ncbi:hypothetical protein TNCV_4219401 [Trichonephila clavipes]|nr:hypothetical protein TNCV_4219401 [Trichonephila clavipes]
MNRDCVNTSRFQTSDNASINECCNVNAIMSSHALLREVNGALHKFSPAHAPIHSGDSIRNLDVSLRSPKATGLGLGSLASCNALGS